MANSIREQRDELLKALKAAEAAMAKTREFNPWDLGPQALVEVREAIAKVEHP